MLNDLFFSVNKILPFFLLILLGAVLRVSGAVKENFFELANKFVFRVALPAHLFGTIAFSDNKSSFSPKLLIFAAFTAIFGFAAVWILCELFFKDKTIIGTFVQGAFRGNFVLLGIPIVQSISGDGAAAKASLAILVVIPLYNILSVIVLTLRGKNVAKINILSLLKKVITTPLVAAVLAALPFWLLDIHIPEFLQRTAQYVGTIATPLGLLSIGGLLSFSTAAGRIRPAIAAGLIKTLVLPLLLLPLAFFFGLRAEELLIIFVMTAAPSAISSYPMACELGGDGPLASGIVIFTTLSAALFFSLGIYALRFFSVI